jgi:hypothetical protein
MRQIKVILSPIFTDGMQWSRDGSLSDQLSRLLFMFTKLPIRRPVLLSINVMGMGHFNIKSRVLRYLDSAPRDNVYHSFTCNIFGHVVHLLPLNRTRLSTDVA